MVTSPPSPPPTHNHTPFPQAAMADIDDLELSGLSEAELLELGELIDPDVRLCNITTTQCIYMLAYMLAYTDADAQRVLHSTVCLVVQMLHTCLKYKEFGLNPTSSAALFSFLWKNQLVLGAVACLCLATSLTLHGTCTPTTHQYSNKYDDTYDDCLFFHRMFFCLRQIGYHPILARNRRGHLIAHVFLSTSRCRQLSLKSVKTMFHLSKRLPSLPRNPTLRFIQYVPCTVHTQY